MGFLLSDLEKVKGPLGLGIERDVYFEAGQDAVKYA